MRLASSIGCPVDRTKDTILPLDVHFKNTLGKEQQHEIVRRRVAFRDIEVAGGRRCTQRLSTLIGSSCMEEEQDARHGRGRSHSLG